MIVAPGKDVEYDLARRLLVETTVRILGTNASEADVIAAAKASVGLANAAAGEMRRLGIVCEEAEQFELARVTGLPSSTGAGL